MFPEPAEEHGLPISRQLNSKLTSPDGDAQRGKRDGGGWNHRHSDNGNEGTGEASKKRHDWYEKKREEPPEERRRSDE